ncbi:MAG: single-stranded DNA-binding protein [Pseudobdellovibrionaceae bacterium]
MAGVNKVIIVGRLGQDPELKTIPSGQQVARLNVATSESFTGKDGSKQERTEWHRITAWGKLADLCGRFLTKGRQVYIEGKLQTRSWEDQQGQKKYATEIVASTVQFLGSNSERQATPSHAADDNNFADFGNEPSFDTSDEIPF